MAYLSDLIIQHPEITSYDQLETLVADAAENGLILLYFNIKPDYPDTPRNWQERLEMVFYRGKPADAAGT